MTAVGSAIRNPIPNPDNKAAYQRRGDHWDMALRQIRGLIFKLDTDNTPAHYPTASHNQNTHGGIGFDYGVSMNIPALHSQPAWFGTVMGTGATSSLLYVTSDRYDNRC